MSKSFLATNLSYGLLLSISSISARLTNDILPLIRDALIFKPLFTTKRSTSTGEEIGTGLGMWLVKLISEDNDARVILLTPREGFGVQIIFPIKYKR